MIHDVYVGRVKKPGGIMWAVQLPGDPRVSYYASKQEANTAAVCVVLESISRRVGRGEVNVSDGLTLQIVIRRGTP